MFGFLSTGHETYVLLPSWQDKKNLLFLFLETLFPLSGFKSVFE